MDKNMTPYLLRLVPLFFILLSSGKSFSAVNDSCATAIAFPPLVLNVQSCLSTDNLTAVAEYPYTYQANCQNGGPMPAPSADVWYSFTAVGNMLDITITGNLTNTTVALYEGSCSGLIGRGCDNTPGGNLVTTIAPTLPGQTYYLQVTGGDVNDLATFDFCIESYEDPAVLCINDQTLTVTPPPTNGHYLPGTTVTFCLYIDGYNLNANDWFHGMVPVFGGGWDVTSITNIVPATSCDTEGFWDWYASITGSNTGLTYGPGFFYESWLGSPLMLIDGNPGNNYGDNCTQGFWNFCFDISTVAACQPGVTDIDLSVEFLNFSDSESGSWNAASPCPGDPNFLFNAVLECCEPEVFTVEPPCWYDSTGYIIAIGNGAIPYFFEWSTGFSEITNDSSSISNLPPGTYSVTVTDNALCTNGFTVIFDATEIIPSVDVTDVGCFGASTGGIDVTATGGTLPYTFILNGGLPQSFGFFAGMAQGNYSVIVQDAAGCFLVIDTLINEPPLLTVDAGNTVEIVLGESTTLDATPSAPVAVYSWAPSTGLDNALIDNPAASPLETTTYTVTVTDANGCVAFDTVTVIILLIAPEIHISNAFTPNGDGINDWFKAYTENVDQFSLRIYNRWGELVYESTDPLDQGWNGTFQNKPQNIGTYVYHLTASRIGIEESIHMKGNITLLR